MEQRDRTETVIVLVVWVLPLLALTALLIAADLTVLAGALVAVELVVGAIVYLVARRPEHPERAPGPYRPWLVPVVMVGVLLGLLVITLLVVQLG